MNLSFTFDFTGADYRTFRREHFNQYRRRRIFLLMLIATVVVNAQLLGRDRDITAQAFLQPLVGLVFVTALYFWVRYRETRPPADVDRYLGPQQLAFDADGIRYENGMGQGTLNWNGIKRYFSTPAAFYLYTDPQRAITLPRRVFGDAAQERQFTELLRSKVPAK